MRNYSPYRQLKRLSVRPNSRIVPYSNIEPYVTCAFPIREARLTRVVFSLRSPLMGGYSRWNILSEDGISDIMPEALGRPPRSSWAYLRMRRNTFGTAGIRWSGDHHAGVFRGRPVGQRALRKRSILRDVIGVAQLTCYLACESRPFGRGAPFLTAVLTPPPGRISRRRCQDFVRLRDRGHFSNCWLKCGTMSWQKPFQFCRANLRSFPRFA